MLLWCLSFLHRENVCKIANGRSDLDFSAQREEPDFLFFFPASSITSLDALCPRSDWLVIIAMDSLRWSVLTFDHG